MISAVIFDFDGVIADSEQLHQKAFDRILTPLGVPMPWTAYREFFIGLDDRDVFRHVIPGVDGERLRTLIDRKADLFHSLLYEDGGVSALPGAVELINRLSGTLPIGICSGALRRDILPVLEKLGIENAFDTIVTAEDTEVGKPDPAPYRLAMQNLGVSDGAAIEDTSTGIISAKGAGLKVLAVTNNNPPEVLHEADAVVPSLEGLTLESLNVLVSA